MKGVFYDSENSCEGIFPIPEQPYPVEIRAKSFLIVPEVQLGAIVAVIAMFAALGLFAYKKKTSK